jgi:light-independent protochlorophyllide reductase subunit B
MKLAYWMYAGPAHIGTLRIASSFKNVHAIMHAPLGDDYFNVMRSMLERERDFTPVTASIVDRHVLARGSQEKVIQNITRKEKEEKPDLIILTPTCTSSILQEDLHNFVEMAKTTIQSKFLVQKSLSNSGVTENTKKILPEGKTDQSDLNQASILQDCKIAQESNVCDVLLADVNHYRVNELQAADRTLEQIVRFYMEKNVNQNGLTKGNTKDNSSELQKNSIIEKTAKPSANIIGIFTLGFHHQHDCRELKRLLHDCGIEINEILPEGCSVHNIKNLSRAWFNIVPYRELGLMTALYLEKEFNMPYISITPMGLVDTSNFLEEIQKIVFNIFKSQGLAVLQTSKTDTDAYNAWDLALAEKQNGKLQARLQKDGVLQACKTHQSEGLVDSKPQLNHFKMDLSACSNLLNIEAYIKKQTLLLSGAAWFSRSIDCQNLTGKKAVVFGDATHAASMTKILAREMGIRVACAGTYCKNDSDWFREQVQGFCDQILITDDHTQVGDIIAEIQPSAIFGTQMERHVGKRLDIPCGVISPPIHIQNFPLGYRPFLGYEGANQIADLVYNSFNLGMEDHLLSIFGGHDTKEVITKSLSTTTDLSWSPDGLAELNKIPGFVRGKVKRNTEKFAIQNSIKTITVDVLFAAKESVGA